MQSWNQCRQPPNMCSFPVSAKFFVLGKRRYHIVLVRALLPYIFVAIFIPFHAKWTINSGPEVC